jgi:hypothetical protein
MVDWIILSLPFAYRGFALRVIPQQGQLLLSQIMKISQVEQRFCPVSYRPPCPGRSFFTP